MSTSHELLQAERVCLELPQGPREKSVRATAELLRGDLRVGEWEDFWAAVGERQIIDLEGCAGRVVLAHGRGASVRELALAAGRQGGPEGDALFFVFAIPSAMAEEYLRKVGALARVCRCGDRLAELRAVASPGDFARLIEGWLD